MPKLIQFLKLLRAVACLVAAGVYLVALLACGVVHMLFRAIVNRLLPSPKQP